MHVKEYPQEELQKWRLWSHVTFVVISVFIFLGYLATKDAGLTADEGWHANQITLFIQGNWTMDPGLTTIPGFHAVVAFIASIVGEHSLGFLRFVSMMISIACVSACRAILMRTTPRLVVVRLVQIAFLPILFPFFFLLYTDVTALTLVLWSIVAFLDRRYAVAFLLTAVSIFIRQMNIVWFLFIVVSWLITEHETLLRCLVRHARRYEYASIYRTLLGIRYSHRGMLNLALILFVMISFGIFLILNGGVAIGDQGSHPFPGIHTGNIFFMAGIFTILFLPYVLSTVSSIIENLREKSWTIPVLTAFFTVYMITAWNSHYYNQDVQSYFIHNRILAYVTSSPMIQFYGFFFVALGAGSIMVTRMQKPWKMLLPATIVCLLPSWLIEQRYYIIPYVLFLLLRTPSTMNVERSVAIYEMILCGILFWIVIGRTFFL